MAWSKLTLDLQHLRPPGSACEWMDRRSRYHSAGSSCCWFGSQTSDKKSTQGSRLLQHPTRILRDKDVYPAQRTKAVVFRHSAHVCSYTFYTHPCFFCETCACALSEGSSFFSFVLLLASCVCLCQLNSISEQFLSCSV